MQDSRRTSDPLQEAESLLEKQQFDQAEIKLQALVKTDTGNPQAWFDLGFAESHLNKAAESISAYQKAAELGPKWFEAHLNLGVALARSGKFAEAVAALRKTVQLTPSGPPANAAKTLSNAWLSLSQALESNEPKDPQSLKEALQSCQKALELNPSSQEIMVALGNAMDRTGDLAGAEKQYLKAAELGNTSGMEKLIGLYLQQKRLAEGESWLRRYLSGNPQSAAAQIQLAHILLREDKIKDAIATLSAVPNASGDPAIARELANLYMQDKQYEAASPIYQQLSKQFPNDAILHWNLGSALLHQHKYAESQAELLKAVQTNPDLADAYWELAYAAQQNKNYELALRALDFRAKFQPENAATYWVRAVSFDSLHAYKQAAENYHLFLTANGGKQSDQEFEARHRLKAIEPK